VPEVTVPGESAARGYALGPGQALPGSRPDVRASRRSTGGSLTLLEVTLNGGPPTHTHTREDESFYVLSGALEVTCGQDRFHAEPGAFVFLPRNVPHRLRSIDGPATTLVIATPGGLDEYFADLHAAARANASPAELRAIQAAYGIIPSDDT
jgi:mannose-6-phosphate isomerase-like protein (cupin superfamily)